MNLSERSLVPAVILLILITILTGCQSNQSKGDDSGNKMVSVFRVVQTSNEILITEKDDSSAIVTQVVRPDFRPYIHPILAPRSEVSLTQMSPGHHQHQTGLFWGFTRVNGTGASEEELNEWFYNPEKPDIIQQKIGRDFFHHPDSNHWKKVSAEVMIPEGEEVKWKTVYHLLDESRNPIMTETQIWSFSQKGGKYFLDLEWTGEALTDITINQFDYGGLFLRMPWQESTKGEIINAARQKNSQTAGQRAMWIDVGMEIGGLDEWGHIALFDHRDNPGYPQPWRVDNQFGIGSAVSA